MEFPWLTIIIFLSVAVLYFFAVLIFVVLKLFSQGDKKPINKLYKKFNIITADRIFYNIHDLIEYLDRHKSKHEIVILNEQPNRHSK
jgi:hypothetical protein